MLRQSQGTGGVLHERKVLARHTRRVGWIIMCSSPVIIPGYRNKASQAGKHWVNGQSAKLGRYWISTRKDLDMDVTAQARP